jgi:hypothetical protein
MLPQYHPCVYRSIETHTLSEHAQYLLICLWYVSIAQAAKRWLVTKETWVQSRRLQARFIVDEQVVEQSFFRVILSSPANQHSTTVKFQVLRILR